MTSRRNVAALALTFAACAELGAQAAPRASAPTPVRTRTGLVTGTEGDRLGGGVC